MRDDDAVQLTSGHAVLVSGRLPRRMRRLAQRRLDGLSERARYLLVTASLLGPSFRLEDAAEMLGETPAMLLPTVEEAMGAGIMTAAENAFSFRHQLLLRRAVGDMIPQPGRKALHRQYGQILLGRGESAAEAAAQHPDPWARASAAEDLGVLYARHADKDPAIHHLTHAIGGYQLTGASADTARIRRRLRKLGVRRRHWTQSASRPVTGWESLTDAERAAAELVAQD